ncbi:hypothetical protein ACFSCX_07220 [Bacillus salitolerans]|uniref:Uncharacterized protein n=1 Tax=Bacillus salitolerans TaxID=1437434 RepID=A0ABW4LMF0_9BACI
MKCIQLYTKGGFVLRDKKEGYHRGDHHRGGNNDGSRPPGPKTFRRGRAVAFLERMNLRRATIKKQLDEPEFQSIHQILVGELKAIDLVINEFTQLFDIHESEAMELHKGNSNEKETSI